jgi:hypothetical protein
MKSIAIMVVSQTDDEEEEIQRTKIANRDEYLTNVEILLQRSFIFPNTLNIKILLSKQNYIYGSVINILSIYDIGNLKLSCKKLYLTTRVLHIKRVLDEKIIPFLVRIDRSVCLY